jgi:hypothetical protein
MAMERSTKLQSDESFVEDSTRPWSMPSSVRMVEMKTKVDCAEDCDTISWIS